MSKRKTMLPAKWERIGNQYVADVGMLHMSVRRKGSAARGDVEWIVDEVFGTRHCGTREWRGTAEEAQQDALAIAAMLGQRFVVDFARLDRVTGAKGGRK
jgi:hypothetical protein